MDGFPPGAIWPADDFKDVQGREVFARFGLAMYAAQVLEHGMVNAFIVLRLMPMMSSFPDRAAWEAAFDRTYDTELLKTFGNMVRALEALDGFPPDLLARLRRAKAERDRLAHRFFREHDTDFVLAAGRTRMIVECEDLVELFQGLDREVEAFAAPTRESFGITKDWIEEHVNLMVRGADEHGDG